MKWSWTIGWIAGIRIRMHWTFLLLLAWIAFSFAAVGGTTAAIVGVLFVLAVFGCVVLHEMGHALVARRYGVATEDITLLPIGGLARMQRIPSEPDQELWIALAGPAVNVVIAAAVGLGLLFTGGPLALMMTPSFAATNPAAFLANLMWVNVFLVLFNALPAFPMDGGRVLRALLAMKIDYTRATNIAAAIGQGMAILFGIIGLFVNPILLFIALFVYLGAEAEAQTVRFRVLLGDAPVREAMMTRFRTLSPHDPLQRGVDELLAGAQQDFPVLDETGFHGILRRQDLIEALKNGDGNAPVARATTAVQQRVGEEDSLQRTVEKMRQLDCRSLPVFRGDTVIGVVTLENVAELIMVRAAVEGQTSAEPTDVERAA